MTDDRTNTTQSTESVSATENNKTQEVAENQQRDIVGEMAQNWTPAIKLNGLKSSKPCDKSEEQLNKSKRTFWISEGGLVCFDRSEAVEYLDSIRHNR